jgi:hypothetical protein
MADIDSAATADEQEKNLNRLLDAVKRMREERFDVTQAVVDALATQYNVTPIPTLAASSGAKAQIVLAPTDAAKVITVDEARQSQGLGPDPDPAKGKLKLAELEAVAEGNADSHVAKVGAAAEADAEVEVDAKTEGRGA